VCSFLTAHQHKRGDEGKGRENRRTEGGEGRGKMGMGGETREREGKVEGRRGGREGEDGDGKGMKGAGIVVLGGRLMPRALGQNYAASAAAALLEAQLLYYA